MSQADLKKNRILKCLLLMILFALLISLMTSLLCANSELPSAKISQISAPTEVGEGELFTLSVEIQNIGEVDASFRLKVKRHFSVVEKQVYVPKGETRNVTFQLRLLLTGPIEIELLYDSLRIDSTTVGIMVPAPMADVGILIMDVTRTQVTIVGVGLAALAIFAAVYTQAKNNLAAERTRVLEKLKAKHFGKVEKNKRRIFESVCFLLENNYDASLDDFSEVDEVKGCLLGFNLPSVRSFYDTTKKTRRVIKVVGCILAILIVFGFWFFIYAPRLVDMLYFIGTKWQARDVILNGYYIPITCILAAGLLSMLYFSYWEEMGIILGIVYSVITVIFFIIFGFRIRSLLIGLASALVLISIAYVLEKRSRKRKYVKEAKKIQELKEHSKMLREKELENMKKEKTKLLEQNEKELELLRVTFNLIRQQKTTTLQDLEVEHLCNLISNKKYRKDKKRLEVDINQIDMLIK